MERLAYSTDEAAQLLNIPASTLTRWRKQGTGPRAVKLGRHIRYPSSDLFGWLDSLPVPPVPPADSPLRGDLSHVRAKRGTGVRPESRRTQPTDDTDYTAVSCAACNTHGPLPLTTLTQQGWIQRDSRVYCTACSYTH